MMRFGIFLLAAFAAIMFGCNSSKWGGENIPTENIPMKLNEINEILDEFAKDYGDYGIAGYIPSDTAVNFLLKGNNNISKALLHGIKTDYWQEEDDVIKHAARKVLEQARAPICFEFFKDYYLNKIDQGDLALWRYFFYDATDNMIDFLYEIVKNSKNRIRRANAFRALCDNAHFRKTKRMQELIYIWITDFYPWLHKTKRENYLFFLHIEAAISFCIDKEMFVKILDYARNNKRHDIKILFRFVNTTIFELRISEFRKAIIERLKTAPKNDPIHFFKKVIWNDSCFF